MSETKSYVSLLAYTRCVDGDETTPNAEAIVAKAARLCYFDSSISDLEQIISSKNQKGFIEQLSRIGHLSPFEHCSFTFGIEGISRACSHQLVRHRIASYSQKSQRYVSENNFDYVVPKIINDNKLARKKFEKAMLNLEKTYSEIMSLLEKDGIKGEAAKQDARFVLPNACETKIIVTMNARELLHFYSKRMCKRAQWEIRDVATKMYELSYAVAPSLFSSVGPSCVTEGNCHEGKMTCGKMAEVKQYFLDIKNKAS